MWLLYIHYQKIGIYASACICFLTFPQYVVKKDKAQEVV